MGEMSLTTLASLAEIIGACSILTGLMFGLFQIRQYRAQQQQPSWGEWFEWLGDRALELKETKEPAHIGYRSWKP